MSDDVPTKRHLQRLAKIHLERYRNRLKDSETNPQWYNVPELKKLLALWGEVVSKGFDYTLLSNGAREEVDDAIEDERPE